ncbi:LamG-like jellyroll fold domain-containing protein [Streptomyces sp. NPDC004528]|uniref:LamG-like jellyroll fold domain-containing protein n=1 Tax=Streptomyces sp. NPDC004528 TaxID=3154550 RepID=UPI0033BA95B3
MAPFLRRRVADRRQPAVQTDNTGKTFTATYGGPPTIGQWAHLVGVYDASTNQITLYVKGRQVDTKAFGGTPWNATGPAQIGRRVALGAYGEYATTRSATSTSRTPHCPRRHSRDR